MNRCENALCNDLINKRRTHHKIGDAYFCSTQCATEWLDTNRKLTDAARRFLEQPVRQRPFVREPA